MHSLLIRQKQVSWIYFLIIVIICVFVYKDYGLSWDEPVQRGIGTWAYKYIHEGDRTYMQITDRIYGVGFELPLLYLEKALKLTDTRDIFLFRHLIQSIFFAFACFIFFRLNLKIFKKIEIAIIPALILLFSPRIFAHAFFNSKDIPFLSMYIICFYTLYNYLLKSSYKNLIILAACAGLLVNFRIMGILFAGSTFFIISLWGLRERKWKNLVHPVLYLGLAGLCLYATWPFLWEKPFIYFRYAFDEMSKFPWQGSMLFKGDVIHPGERLTEYLMTWIGISVPLLYLMMMALGITIFIFQSLRKPLQIFADPFKLMGWVLLANAVVPLIAVLYLKSILYDDWRQLYFVYPALICFSGYLLYYLIQFWPRITKSVYGLMLIYLGFIGFQMIRLHPYEHIYFNELVPRKNNYIQHHFDQDYWGTSFYEGLTHIVQEDPSDTIQIFLFHDALRRNVMMLPEKDRKRINFLQYEGSEKRSHYYLTTFRYDYVDIVGRSHYQQTFYEVKRQNSVVMKIWKH